MSVNAAGAFNPSWFAYKPVDPTGKAGGQYAIIKPEHREDVESFYAAQREQHLQETRELRAQVRANGSVKLTDEQKAALSEKYDPTDMSRQDYARFVDDLYEYGVLEGDDRDWVQARADGLTLAIPGATHTVQRFDPTMPLMSRFEDCGGNVLHWAGYMSSFAYFDQCTMGFAPTKSALLFGKIEDVLKQI